MIKETLYSFLVSLKVLLLGKVFLKMLAIETLLKLTVFSSY